MATRGTSGTSDGPVGVSRPGQARAQTLTSLDLRTTDGLFAGLPAPVPGAVDGPLRGRLLAATGIQHLPMPARSVLYALVNGGLGLWWGKEFHGDAGSDVWIDEHGPRLGTYSVRPASAGDGSGPVLRLDYGAGPGPEVGGEPRRSRAAGFHAEVRTVRPGRHLGRLLLTTNATTRRLLYFGLDS